METKGSVAGVGDPSERSTPNITETPLEEKIDQASSSQQRYIQTSWGPTPKLPLQFYIQLWKDYLVESEACEDPDVKREYEELLALIQFNPHPGFETEQKKDMKEGMLENQLKAAIHFWKRYGQYQEAELSKGLEDVLEAAKANGEIIKPSVWEEYVYSVELLQKIVRACKEYK
ncbi:hypothetical protein DM02DRAFT_635001 [Periconia macrospinosa]|uniref:Uncharacterized protein n=1 Tax=Periconia macrospinosa TaxID=97972 RepID=A0A2V1D5S2_9PLEO|nr:hypothetical protein DM02DRAFT_635001 [Periconia macrospinosa]